jgi:hypothetical protein
LSGVEINRSGVIAQVRAAFEDYEAALLRHDVAALNDCFLQRPDTVRFGLAEHNYGAAAIADWRADAAAVDVSRRLLRVVIVAFGDDAASVCAEFESALSPRRGRQSQMWVRRPEGWKIASAHVSEIDAGLIAHA